MSVTIQYPTGWVRFDCHHLAAQHNHQHVKVGETPTPIQYVINQTSCFPFPTIPHWGPHHPQMKTPSAQHYNVPSPIIVRDHHSLLHAAHSHHPPDSGQWLLRVAPRNCSKHGPPVWHHTTLGALTLLGVAIPPPQMQLRYCCHCLAIPLQVCVTTTAMQPFLPHHAWHHRH